MKIVFFETMPGEQEEILKYLPTGHDIRFIETPLSEETLQSAYHADIISVFVKSNITANVIDHLPNLQLIATRSMGVDHIDVAFAKTKNIPVTNVQTYAAHPVAEFTFALLLAVSRKIYPAYNHVRDGGDFQTRGLTGFNLFGKTMGIVGTGRIGKNVALIAKGFGMRVQLFDIMPDPDFSRTHSMSYMSLNDIAAQSDVLSIHVPRTPETYHLINAPLFGKMKRGVVIINTARGDIIDTHALIAALRNGIVAGAGLDVLEDERNIREEFNVLAENRPNVDYAILAANHVLIDLPTVVVTPHIAFATTEAMHEISRVTGETIAQFIARKN